MMMTDRGFSGLVLIMRIVLFAAGLLMNLYLGFHFTCRDCIAIVAQANQVAHFITLIAVMIFALAVGLRVRWWLLVWLAPGAVMFFVWYGQHFLPKPEPDVEGTEFIIATYNVLGYGADPERTFAVVKAMDADIVAFQELRPTLQGKIESDLADEYPYQTFKIIDGFDGWGLISRYPFVENEISTSYDPRVPSDIRAVIDMNGQHIAVYGYHPPFPGFQLWHGYDDRFNRENVYNMQTYLANEELPILLLCDCNFTQRTRQYAWINTILDDSFSESGWGFGLTHPGYYRLPFPAIRIDYIWHSEAFTALEAKVWDDNGTSDHHPMWARLVLHNRN